MESIEYTYSYGKQWKNSKDQFHRENDLPAIEYYSGYKAWFINGKCHRELGPAVIYTSGLEFWYLNDICYNHNMGDVLGDMPMMPIKLFMIYCNWEYRKKNGI